MMVDLDLGKDYDSERSNHGNGVVILFVDRGEKFVVWESLFFNSTRGLRKVFHNHS